jgi:hypothetical protein
VTSRALRIIFSSKVYPPMVKKVLRCVYSTEHGFDFGAASAPSPLPAILGSLLATRLPSTRPSILPSTQPPTVLTRRGIDATLATVAMKASPAPVAKAMGRFAIVATPPPISGPMIPPILYVRPV